MPVIDDQQTEQVNDNEIIWKFLSLPKFLDLLQRKALFFCKVSVLHDKWEGMNNPKLFTKKYWEVFLQIFPEEQKKEEEIKTRINTHKAMSDMWRERSSVCCWHLSKYEPAGFWKLYSDREFGLAIKSTIGQLKKSLEVEKRSLIIGKVKYIDYENEVPPIGHVLAPFFYKRNSFDFEKEVRVCSWTDSTNNLISDELDNNPGAYINIDPQIMISNLVLSPESPPWYNEIIKKLLSEHQIAPEIIQTSNIDQNPQPTKGLHNYKVVK